MIKDPLTVGDLRDMLDEALADGRLRLGGVVQLSIFEGAGPEGPDAPLRGVGFMYGTCSSCDCGSLTLVAVDDRLSDEDAEELADEVITAVMRAGMLEDEAEGDEHKWN